ncbi:invasion associated locus B family protein [Enterovirga rhinocerotis]|nr:invasion associated locus B family protein [Enterovirga rhinocerotis]
MKVRSVGALGRRAACLRPGLRGALVAAAVLAASAATAQQRPAAAPAKPAPAVTQPAPAAQLPNGANAINETFGDWTVDCRITDNQKRCVLSQVQGNRQTGQRVFALELDVPKDGKTEGTILMPFGVNLGSGALLKLDDKDLGQGLRFSTCMQQGCLLPVSLPTVATDAMRAGKTLVVASLNLSTGEPITFNVSLDGFGAALDRTIQLGR